VGPTKQEEAAVPSGRIVEGDKGLQTSGFRFRGFRGIQGGRHLHHHQWRAVYGSADVTPILNAAVRHPLHGTKIQTGPGLADRRASRDTAMIVSRAVLRSHIVDGGEGRTFTGGG